MVEVVVVVTGTEGQQLERSPTEHVPGVAIVGVPHPEESPDRGHVDVDGAKYNLGHFHVDPSGDSIRYQKLDKVAVNASD